ncbi:MAG: AAA family ATPase [Bacteroidota bacterium]
MRRKWLIIAVAVSAAAAAYFFVDRMDEKFRATAVVSTGIVDVTPDLSKENPWIQQFYVDMGFGNLIEFINSQRNVIFLTYRLLIHDLAQGDDVTERPFRQPEYQESDEMYTDAELQELRELLLGKVENLEYTLDDSRMERIFKTVSEAYKYDYESLMKDNLSIIRKGDTDLLHVSFICEHPDLSAFATNAFCKDFLKNYQYVQQEGEVSSVRFLSEQVKYKKQQVDSLRQALKFYQGRENLADLEGQREAVINQIKELETTRTEYGQKKKSLAKSIAEVDQYLQDNDRKSEGDKAVLIVNNQNIQNMQKQLNTLNEEWIKGDMKDDKLKRRIDLIRKNMTEQIEKSAKNLPDEDDKRLKKRSDDLLKQRIDLEIEYNEAVAGFESVENALADARVKANSFVSDEAYMNQLRQELKIAETQHELMFSEYSKEKLNLDNSILPVKLFQHAQIPDKSEPKMKALISGFSGIVGGTMASVLVFLLAFMDYSISSPDKFRKFARLNLIGTINKINTKKLDFHELFNSGTNNKSMAYFKEAIRNLRYTVEQSGAQRFLVTSTKPGEGKTFAIIALANSLTLKNKKVLLVDTNFKNNTLTKMSQKEMQENLLHSKLIGESHMEDEFEPRKISDGFNLDNIDIIGNKGSFQSPSEVFAGKDFASFLDRISKNYDYVFLEAAALNDYSDSKELIDYAEQIITVFSAETEIKAADKNSISFVHGLGDKFLGAILNKVDIKNLG